MGNVRLDCSSPDTALSTVAVALKASEGDVVSLLEQVDSDNHRIFGQRHPFLSLCQDAGLNFTESMETVWFHLTRSCEPESFRGGIKPLGQVIDSMWLALEPYALKHVSKSQWAEFRDHVDRRHDAYHADLYRKKCRESFHWGPYGILVRESAFCAEALCNHDYLRVPEIIEDICICFRHSFAADLYSAYRKVAVPVIVKFWAPGLPDHALDAALAYLWLHRRREAPSFASNTCFDAGGAVVGPEQVIAVEVNPKPICPTRLKRRNRIEHAPVDLSINIVPASSTAVRNADTPGAAR